MEGHTLGVTYTIQVFHLNIGLFNCTLDNFEGPLSMVLSGVSWKESFSGRRYICVSYISKRIRGTIHSVLDDPCTQLVG